MHYAERREGAGALLFYDDARRCALEKALFCSKNTREIPTVHCRARSAPNFPGAALRACTSSGARHHSQNYAARGESRRVIRRKTPPTTTGILGATETQYPLIIPPPISRITAPLHRRRRHYELRRPPPRLPFFFLARGGGGGGATAALDPGPGLDLPGFESGPASSRFTLTPSRGSRFVARTLRAPGLQGKPTRQ